MEINSKFKIFGGFYVILALNIFVVWGNYMLFFELHAVEPEYIETIEDALVPALLIFFQIFVLALLFTQARRIRIDHSGITFINPVLPFINRNFTWDYFDEAITVMEKSRSGSYEAIWFIKDNKLVYRISSYYYRNYEEMKKNIRLGNIRRRNIGFIRTIIAYFGGNVRKVK